MCTLVFNRCNSHSSHRLKTHGLHFDIALIQFGFRYDPSKKPPFDVGFEGLGEIVQKGAKVTGLSPNQPVAYMKYGSFSEYQVLEEKEAIPLPDMRKEYLALLVSGLTAGISLDKVGEMKPGQNECIMRNYAQ